MTDTSTVESVTAQIQAHPLCASFVTTPQKFVVFYPSTYVVPNGAAVQRGSDDLGALTLLYQRLENFWNAQRLQVPAST